MSRLMMAFLFSIVLFTILPNDAIAVSSSDVVYKSQNWLKELGYNPGISDGIFGKITQAALIEFQRDYNLPKTAVLDKKTLNRLEASVVPERRENKRPQDGRVDPETIPKPEPSVHVAAHTNNRMSLTQRDDRLDAQWGLVSPTGCYWECQQPSGCHDGHKGDLSQLASQGTKRGVDAQRVYHHPGWTQVCD